jgi:hypothetical protein
MANLKDAVDLVSENDMLALRRPTIFGEIHEALSQCVHGEPMSRGHLHTVEVRKRGINLRFILGCDVTTSARVKRTPFLTLSKFPLSSYPLRY